MEASGVRSAPPKAFQLWSLDICGNLTSSFAKAYWFHWWRCRTVGSRRLAQPPTQEGRGHHSFVGSIEANQSQILSGLRGTRPFGGLSSLCLEHVQILPFLRYPGLVPGYGHAHSLSTSLVPKFYLVYLNEFSELTQRLVPLFPFLKMETEV